MASQPFIGWYFTHRATIPTQRLATSLAWLWIAEGQRPSTTDLLGAAIAIGGAMVIVGMANKTP